MNYSTYRFTLDLHTTKSQLCLHIPQYSTAVQFYINLTDGGKPYSIIPGVTAKLFGKKADGFAIISDCTVEGDRILYRFSEQTASCLGLVNCEIRLYSEDEEPLSLISPKFDLLITERAVNDSDVIDSAPELSVLDEILAKANIYEQNEATREGNESSRIQAELLRESGEDGRAEAERQRNVNEEFRIECENERRRAEEQRNEKVQEIAGIVGDMDAALDAILAIQESILGVLEYELGTSSNGDKYYIVKGIGTYKSSDIVIPDTYKGIVVSKIAEEAFKGNTKLTSAVIGKNVLTIGKCAFEGCSNLTSIQLTKERKVYEVVDGWWNEECYGQTDSAFVPRLASDNDPQYVAQLLTSTIVWDEDLGYISTNAWYWTALPN